MKLGVERVLREKFPFLQTIEAISPPPSPPALTPQAVLDSLAPVRQAVTGMGGAVDVRSVDADAGKVVLAFKGPPRLKQGISLILRELKAIQSIDFVEF